MALILSRFSYGLTVVLGTNDKLDFIELSGGNLTATLTPGDYTPGSLAGEIQRAMRAAEGNNNVSVTFLAATKAFQFIGGATFTLKFGTQPSGASCGNLVGATVGGGAGNDITGTTIQTTFGFIGGVNNGTVWELAEPVQFTSPNSPANETGAAVGASGSLLMRDVRVTQNVSDGKKVETVYINTIKRVQISFWALTSSEQAKFESFMDWAERGRPFLWQPDKTAAPGLRLKLEVGSGVKIENQFEWITRSESTYPRLTFIEDVNA